VGLDADDVSGANAPEVLKVAVLYVRVNFLERRLGEVLKITLLGNSVHNRKPGFIADSSSLAIRSKAQLLRLYTAIIGKEGKG